MLVPVEGVLRPLIALSERDPDAADMLVELGLYESMHDQIGAYRPHIERTVAKAMLAAVEQDRRALIRSYVSKRVSGEAVTGMVEVAAGLTVAEHQAVTKALFRRDDPRTPYWDARTPDGRFAADIPTGASHQAARQGVHAAVQDWRNTGIVGPEDQVTVRGYQGKGKDKTHGVLRTTHRELGSTGLPKEFTPTRVISDNAGLTGNRGAVFDVGRKLVGGHAASRVARGPWDSESFNRELTNVTRTGEGSDRRAWRQLSATGRALQQVSTPGSTASTVGAVSRLVGDLGPQAETVLGPGIKRTAYRYRGTERRPSSGLVRAVSEVDVDNPPAPDTPPGGVIGYYAGKGATHRGVDPETDQLELRARGDTAVGYFMRKLPTAQQTEISIAAGRVPPSQGVIIDASGDVTSEAMGADGDHYLPFDLKNLKALKGGQYVRTRAMGGPSTEDVYAGLLTGARQVQVVSNSGVFTMEFDPDLRGGRRYSDKARSMIGRYRKLLDAIDQSEASDLFANLPAEERTRLKRQALTEVGPSNKDALDARYKELVNEAVTESSWSGRESEEELDSRAEALVTAQEGKTGPLGTSGRAAALRETKGKLTRDLKDQRIRRFQLDGEGYYAAMRSLQEEFPYFIRSVDYESVDEFAENRNLTRPGEKLPSGVGSRDRGYVKPKAIAAGAASRAWANKPEEQQVARPAAAATVGGSGAAPGGSAALLPGGATTSGTGAQLVKPVRFQLEPVTDTLTDALRKRKDDVKRSLGAALGGISGPIVRMQLTMQKPPIEDNEETLRAWDDEIYAQAIIERHTDPDKLSTFMMDNPESLSKFKSGLDIIGERLPQYPDAGLSPDRLHKANEQLALASLVGEGFAATGDPETYGADAADPGRLRPLRFAEIDALGDNKKNYAAFEAAADSELKEAITEMQSPPGGASPGEHIAAEARKRVNAERWAKAVNPNSPPPGGELPPGVSSPVTARAYLANPANKRRQVNLNAAWSFLAAREAVGALLGGGAGPKEQVAHQAPLLLRAPDGDDRGLRVAKALLATWVAETELDRATR